MTRWTRVAGTLAVLFVTSSAQAATILVFGQNTGLNLTTATQATTTTTVGAQNVPLTITALNSAGANLAAFLNWTAASTAPAVNVGGSAWTQAYAGNFHITAGQNSTGINYLSGVFTGVQLGIVGGHTLIFGSSQPPLVLSFTSDVAGLPLANPAMAFSLTNVLPQVAIVNGTFAPFTANISGDFSADVIPEPATVGLLALGLAGMLAQRRRRD